jgi:hypothetical protein
MARRPRNSTAMAARVFYLPGSQIQPASAISRLQMNRFSDAAIA